MGWLGTMLKPVWEITVQGASPQRELVGFSSNDEESLEIINTIPSFLSPLRSVRYISEEGGWFVQTDGEEISDKNTILTKALSIPTTMEYDTSKQYWTRVFHTNMNLNNDQINHILTNPGVWKLIKTSESKSEIRLLKPHKPEFGGKVSKDYVQS